MSKYILNDSWSLLSRSTQLLTSQSLIDHMQYINKSVVEQAIDYISYRTMIDDLFAQNKTTGDNHSEAMIHYTKMNISRMKRLDKTTRLSEAMVADLKSIDQPLTLLVITEAWCGDAAQSIPVINKMVEENDLLELKFILRDQHLDIMDAFLTNGGRSIPKVLVLDSNTLEVLNTWGPRPTELQNIFMEGRSQVNAIEEPTEKKAAYQRLSTELQRWHTKDKAASIQREMMECLNVAAGVSMG
ncbi:MAG: thioredoxin family protein [Chitinophagales bacterium]|nr:thioredoxin family protein [Chitinophagales bacterium]